MLQLENAISCNALHLVMSPEKTKPRFFKKDQRPNRTEAETGTADYSTRENVSCLKHWILLS